MKTSISNLKIKEFVLEFVNGNDYVNWKSIAKRHNLSSYILTKRRDEAILDLTIDRELAQKIKEKAIYNAKLLGHGTYKVYNHYDVLFIERDKLHPIKKEPIPVIEDKADNEPAYVQLTLDFSEK